MKGNGVDDKMKEAGHSALSVPGVHLPAVPQFDAEEFRQYVDGFDITEEQKIEYLHRLWAIAVAFVDLGWGTSSVQNILPLFSEISMDSQGDDVQKRDQEITPGFNGIAPGASERKEGRDDR